MQVKSEETHYLTMSAGDRKCLHQLFEHVPSCDEKLDIHSQLFVQVNVPLSPRTLDWLKGMVQNPVCDDEPPFLAEFRERLFNTLPWTTGVTVPMHTNAVIPPADKDDIPF